MSLGFMGAKVAKICEISAVEAPIPIIKYRQQLHSFSYCYPLPVTDTFSGMS